MTDKIECNIFTKSYIGTIAVVNFAKEFQLNELKYWSMIVKKNLGRSSFKNL